MIPEKVKGGDRVTLEGERACPSFEQIAAREKCSVRKVNMTISLAFLAPDLVKAAIEGRLPRGLGVARLCGYPAEWSRQYQILGLPSPYRFAMFVGGVQEPINQALARP